MKNKSYYDELDRHVKFRTQRIKLDEAEINKIRKRYSEMTLDELMEASEYIRNLKDEIKEDQAYCDKAREEIREFYRNPTVAA